MDSIHFAENLINLRREKKVTQEQLAEFCGVTKASVSKWETRQTIPDVLLLPRLAAFFGITIDELLGYEVCLSKEQIHKIYEELAAEFATKDFDTAMSKCRQYVKQYYSCYEFVEKIVLLWIGHEMLAGEKRQVLLQEAKMLCEHILEKCRNISLCNDVVFMRAVVDLLLGKPEEVIAALEDMNNPCRLSVQGEEVLLSAYIEMGEMEKGDDFAQVTMYLHLICLVSEASRFLVLHKKNLDKCEETKRRIENVIQLYSLEEINFHIISLFYYQMAEIYCFHGENAKALEQVEQFVNLMLRFLRGEIEYLQNDSYLDRLNVWFKQSILDGNYSRDKVTVRNTLLMLLETPTFDVLKDEEIFRNLKKKVKEMEVSE